MKLGESVILTLTSVLTVLFYHYGHIDSKSCSYHYSRLRVVLSNSLRHARTPLWSSSHSSHWSVHYLAHLISSC